MKQFISNSRLFERITIAALSLCLIACNLIRILRVPLTVDESPSRSDLLLSYWDYVRLTKVTANIHILNSILRKASIELLGNSPFALRLPVFLAHILFLVFGYLLVCRLFKEGYWRVCVFLILNLNSFIFEFWGYSRGYGLALGFMITSIYFLVSYVEEKRKGQLWTALLFAALAVWSNFSLLNFYVALVGVLVLNDIISVEGRRFLRTTLPAVLTVSGILGLLIFDPIRKLKIQGELYYGGEKSVLSDTVGSLVRESLYLSDTYADPVKIVALIVIVLTVASLCYWILAFIRKRRKERLLVGVDLLLLLLIPVFSTAVQHQWFNTKYLIDRTAMFLIILCLLNICYSIYIATARLQYVGIGMIVVIAAAHVWNFSQHITLHKSRPWWMDNYNLEVLNRLAPKSNDMGRPLTMRPSWNLMPSLDYYVYTRYQKQFEPLEFHHEAPGPADTAFDYLYLTMDDVKNVSEQYVVDSNYEGVCVLYRRKRMAR